MICENKDCGSTNDVVEFYRGDKRLVMCAECRIKTLSPGTRRPLVGRPSLGVTKKISLTLVPDDWTWLDGHQNRSEVIRDLIRKERMPATAMSNSAAAGYMIAAMKTLGYDDEAIRKMEKTIYYQFDMMTIDEAKQTYNRFT
jgi:hypothetical protein